MERICFILGIFILVYKIFQHGVYSDNNTQQGKNGGIDLVFVTRAFIKLKAGPGKNSDDGEHLNSHPGIFHIIVYAGTSLGLLLIF